MASGGLHSLATIIKRLEAATSRLEDIALHNVNPSQAAQTTAATATTSAAGQPEEIPRSVVAFDESIINARVIPWVGMSHQLGGPIDEQAKLVAVQYKSLREVILTASQCSKPDNKAFAALVQPLQKCIDDIAGLKDKNRSSKEWFNHLATVAEGAPAVGWITIDNKPAPHVSEMKDSAQFYANRLIKEFRDKNQKHVEWARAYIAILEDMKKYVLEYHTTGLVWKPKGIAVTEYMASSSSPSATAGAAAPPPPPPPPPPALPSSSPSTQSASANPAAVFAELNRGEDVTKGLRKVDKSEMTHKNPSLRGDASSVPGGGGVAATPKRPAKPTKPHSLAGKKPAKFALEGNKWVIEHQENEASLVVEDPQINQVVYVFGCKNTTIQVKGKVNAVALLNCTKTSVLADSVISSISVTSSPSFAVQVTGSCPTVQLDSTDSGQVYLSQACVDAGTEIISAKCSAINVSVPDPKANGEEGLFVERSVPEMMRSVVGKNGQLTTNIVEHSA